MPVATSQDATDDAVADVGSKRERTRAKLLCAAREVFEDLGYTDTRVADITKAAGVGHGTFYGYYRSKEDVFKELAREVSEDLLRAQGGPHTGQDLETYHALHQAITRYLAAFRRNARMIAMLEEVATHEPEIRQSRLEVRDRLCEVSSEALEQLRRKHSDVPSDLDIPYTAQLLGAMVDRFAYTWFVLGADYEEERALEALTKSYLRMVGINHFE